jgi:hypothetical protein
VLWKFILAAEHGKLLHQQYTQHLIWLLLAGVVELALVVVSMVELAAAQVDT